MIVVCTAHLNVFWVDSITKQAYPYINWFSNDICECSGGLQSAFFLIIGGQAFSQRERSMIKVEKWMSQTREFVLLTTPPSLASGHLHSLRWLASLSMHILTLTEIMQHPFRKPKVAHFRYFIWILFTPISPISMRSRKNASSRY